MGRLLFLLCCACVLTTRASAEPQVLGLDHIPIAVRDLERAGADFAALGFALKPGRPHANGLRNLHAKFPDGTELELITATAAVDPLSSEYVEWLKEGDGPILLGLYAPDAKGAVLPRPFFFDGRQKSPTDRPEHFAHANSAYSLRAAWTTSAPPSVGIEEKAASCAPFGASDRRLRLPEGEIVLLPPRIGRPIVAATVAVRSLDPVRHLAIAGCTPDSLWVQTHGLWLEFRQQP